MAVTKLLSVPWESDRLYKNAVDVTFVTPPDMNLITGYQFKLAMIPSSPPLLWSLQSAQVLWFIYGPWGGGLPGKVTYKDYSGSAQNLHGSGAVSNLLAADILKASPWYTAVDDVICVSGLHLPTPPNTPITMRAAHAGQGPVDFEVQGVIFYE